MKKKLFFREPTAAQIRKRREVEVASKDLLEAIAEIDDNYLSVQGEIVPPGFRSHKQFEKHGLEIFATHPETQQLTIAQGKFPYQQKREAVTRRAAANHVPYVSWAVNPFGLDRRKIRILFSTNFEGARLYAYACTYEPIEVKPYTDAKRVATEGGEVFVKVPSTSSEEPYKFKFMSAPIINSPERFAISHNLGADHSCLDVSYTIRYKRESDLESSRARYFCQHINAGWLGVIEHFWREQKNKVPLNCGLFDIPTEQAVEFYKVIRGRILIQPEKNSRAHKPDRAQTNIIIGQQLLSAGYDWMFYPRLGITQTLAVRDYNWKIE